MPAPRPALGDTDVDTDDVDVDADGDGFTEPSVAGGGMKIFDVTRSCDECVHQDVCILFAGVQRDVDDWLERFGSHEDTDAEDPPFEPADVAVVCDSYEHRDDTPK